MKSCRAGPSAERRNTTSCRESSSRVDSLSTQPISLTQCARESKLRDKTSGLLSQLDAKYNAGGAAAKRGAGRKTVKVFDDDLSEDEEETIVRGEDGWMGGSDDEESEGDESEEEDDESEDDEDDEEDEDEDEGDDDDDEEEQEDEEENSAPQPIRTSKSSVISKTLDPLAALQASKSKEVLKGRAILRQQVRSLSLPQWVSPSKLMSCRRKP